MKKRLITLISIVLGSIFLDQLTKILVLKLMDLHDSITIIPGMLNITYIQNRGAAFGMLSDHRWVFMVISTLTLIGMGIYLFGFCKERMLMQVGLAMIIGGGIGNRIDRTVYSYVVDMIDFCLFDFWMWIFNVADAFVCVGAGIVIYSLILDIIRDSKKKDDSRK